MIYTIGFIISLVIIVLLYIFYKGEVYPYVVVDVNSKLDMVSLHNTKFRTGDLIMFRYDHFSKQVFDRWDYYEMIISCLPCKLPFTHVGMIVIINETPYITHIANYTIVDGSGKCTGYKSDLYDLYDYLDNYKGNIYHCKYNGSNLDNYYLYKKMEIYENMPFKLDHITLLDSIFSTDLAGRKNNTLTCASYVVSLLSDAGILNNITNANHFNPNLAVTEAYKTGNYMTPSILINKYALGHESKETC